MMDVITFQFLISLTVSKSLDMYLMDVVKVYLYRLLDADIYMKIPEKFKMPEAFKLKDRTLYSIKQHRFLYGLKQSGYMWYHCLSEYIIKEGYVNNLIYSCVFIKKTELGFTIVAVYVDYINLIGTPKELLKTIKYLKKEFEMKDMEKN